MTEPDFTGNSHEQRPGTSLSRLRQLDLQLLLIFSSICRHRMLAAAASELNCSTSAISHSVNRLRELFGDPLFIRRKDGVSLTPLAMTLLPRVEHIVLMSTQILDIHADFDAAKSTRWFTIGTSEYNEALFGPPLSALCERQAPSIRITFKVLTREKIVEQVVALGVDMAIGSFRGSGEDVEVEALCRYRYFVVEQGARARMLGPMTPERYLAARHANIAFESPPQAPIESLMTSLGHSRRIGVNFPHIMAALMAAAKTDLLLTLPRHIPQMFDQALDLKIHDFPFPQIDANVSIISPVLARGDPSLQWLRQKVREIASDLND